MTKFELLDKHYGTQTDNFEERLKELVGIELVISTHVGTSPIHLMGELKFISRTYGIIDGGSYAHVRIADIKRIDYLHSGIRIVI